MSVSASCTGLIITLLKKKKECKLSACLPGVHADSNVHISNALRGGGGGGGEFMPHPLVPGIIQWRRMGILIMRVSSILYLVLV